MDTVPPDSIGRSLIEAQRKAEALFAEVVETGLIQAGKLESELTSEIHALARCRFKLRRHWHKRLARCGPNTLLGYYEEAPDRRIAEDDVVYLDLGPVFGAWEADFGRTYALGSDPKKHQLVRDIAAAFHRDVAGCHSGRGCTGGARGDQQCPARHHASINLQFAAPDWPAMKRISAL